MYLTRRDAFFRVHPTKKIFPSKQGQNWQILLPLAYRCKYGYINEPLCVYVVRVDSHSHAPRSLQQQVERHLDCMELLTATIKQLNAPNETELLNFVWAKFMHKNLVLAINYGNTNLILDCCRKAQEKRLDIFGADTFNVKFLLDNYILPRINLQSKLAEIQADISKINDKLKS